MSQELQAQRAKPKNQHMVEIWTLVLCLACPYVLIRPSVCMILEMFFGHLYLKLLEEGVFLFPVSLFGRGLSYSILQLQWF